MKKQPTLYQVQKIIGVLVDQKNDTYYLVKWKGYKPRNNSWEPQANLKRVHTLILRFYRDRLMNKKLAKGLKLQQKNFIAKGVKNPSLEVKKRGRPFKKVAQGINTIPKRKTIKKEDGKKRVRRSREQMQALRQEKKASKKGNIKLEVKEEDLSTQKKQVPVKKDTSKGSLQGVSRIIRRRQNADTQLVTKPINSRIFRQLVAGPRQHKPGYLSKPKPTSQSPASQFRQDDSDSEDIQAVLLTQKSLSRSKLQFKDCKASIKVSHGCSSTTLRTDEIMKINPSWLIDYYKSFIF